MDFDAHDGVTTGLKSFNERYNVDSRYAARYGSLITAQNGVNVNPALYLLTELFFDIDGDGFCLGDCDGDGAAGQGDGNADEADDDGLVGINSQQMGYRLRYEENPGAAWGMFRNLAPNVRGPLFHVVSIGAVLLIGFYFTKLTGSWPGD